MQLKIRHELKRMERTLGAIGEEVINKAAPIAINRTTKTLESVAVKSISKTTGIKQKDVRQSMRQKLAHAGERQLSAYIDAKAGRAKNLAGFVTPARRKLSEGAGRPQFFRRRLKNGAYKYPGVDAKAWNTKRTYAGTFIRKGASGNTVVLTRTGDRRGSKLKALRGPSIRQELIRDGMQRTLTAKANERFPIELKRAIDVALRRYK